MINKKSGLWIVRYTISENFLIARSWASLNLNKILLTVGVISGMLLVGTMDFWY